jgi:hypothetical protein
MFTYAPLGERPGFVPADASVSPSRFPIPAPAQSYVFTPGPSEISPLVPPMLRPGPGSAARFILLYTIFTCVARARVAGGAWARGEDVGTRERELELRWGRVVPRLQRRLGRRTRRTRALHASWARATARLRARTPPCAR